MYEMITLIPKPSRLKLPLPFLLTPWLHYLLISSLRKLFTRSEKPLKSSAVSTVASPRSASTHSTRTVFFLVTLFLQSVSSHCQSCMPITTKPTGAEQVILFSGELGRCKGGVWGRPERCIFGEERRTLSATGAMLSDSAWHEFQSHGARWKRRREDTVVVCFNSS